MAGIVLSNRDDVNLAWGGYFEASRGSEAGAGTGTVFGIEVAVKNKQSDITNNPFSRFPGGSTIGIWLAGGSDATFYGAPTNPSTCAILIGKNATTWNKGIVFDATGITGTDGVTGTGVAISMAKGHVLEWQYGSGLVGSTITSNVTSAANKTSLAFNNNSAWFLVADALVGTISKGGGTANYPNLISSATGAPVQLSAAGTDTDIDIQLLTKGVGVLQLGYQPVLATVNTNFVANYHLKIKGPGGTAYYIPCTTSTW